MEKNPQTDSATLGLTAFFPSFIEITAFGWINLVISPALCFARTRVLITFMPPPVDPAQAPIKAVKRSKIGTNRGQLE